LSHNSIFERIRAELLASDFEKLVGGSTVEIKKRVRTLRSRPAKFAALVGLIAVAVSVPLTALVMSVLEFPPRMFWSGIGIGTLVPSLVAPPLGWVFAKLMIELDDARKIAERLATTDSLTGVFNRRRFLELAEGELERGKRQSLPLSVFLLDIDHFKTVNDTHGHATGDAVLRDVAQICVGQLRKYDVLARFGGEEFAVLLPNTDITTALSIAERLRAAVEASESTIAGSGIVKTSVSIGVAGYSASRYSLTIMLGAADKAMYEAKRSGRNQVRCAPEPATVVTERPADTVRLPLPRFLLEELSTTDASMKKH
jgi:diguanylate cyclase (GGDEF)-like protein